MADREVSDKRHGGVWPSLLSGLIVAGIPILQIGLVYRLVWSGKKVPVNRHTCKCSCFDTFFKGQYEQPGENVGYKHIYFNATFQTSVIWMVTVTFALLAYESFRRVLRLLATHRLRLSMAIAFLVGIYPHVYGWWGFFNYFNDDFYSMFVNQLYFTVTDLISTFFILRLCSMDVPVDSESCIIIVVTSINHILIGGFNQFFTHFLTGRAHFFQLSRDWNLFLPDVLCLAIAGTYLWKSRSLRKTKDISVMHLTDVLTSRTPKVVCYTYALCITILGFTMY